MSDSGEPLRPPRRISWVARVLGPLALIAVVIAVFLIINGSIEGDGGESTTSQIDGGSKTDDKEGPETPRTYTVQAGDSLTSIAEKFGVSVKRLERLNPDVDPQALSGELTLR